MTDPNKPSLLNPDAVTFYVCKFCVAKRGLKVDDLKLCPTTEQEALDHVRDVHGYPAQSARLALQANGNLTLEATAMLIERTSPIWGVQLLSSRFRKETH